MAQEPIDWSWLSTTLATTGGVVGGYLTRIIFDRKKLRAENTSAELDSDTKAVELYERFASQLNPKIEALQTKIETLTDQVITLKEENANLRVENKQHKLENSTLKAELQGMHTQIAELKLKIK